MGVDMNGLSWCRTHLASLGTQRREHLGSAFLVSPVFPQIQKPVVKTDMEQLAQELEGLAQAQVRREQRETL